nr:nucleoside/nucleotide kinase family protein [Paracoccus saliphilus]
MTQAIDLSGLLQRLATLVQGPRRHLVALAGPPAAGKSHICDILQKQLPAAGLLQMDGFHLDDRLLRRRGLLARKGAPETFDLDGFTVMLDRLAADDGRDVLVPVFDRGIETSRAAAAEITSPTRLILVEGNYLLLDRPGWRDLARHFALTVMLEAPEPVLRARLEGRWAGYDTETLHLKLDKNDLPNMRLVLKESRPADLVLPTG